MIKNIIFDWSGVINDSLENQLEVINAMFKELGSREISLAEMKEHWEQPYMRFYNKFLPDLTLEEEQAAFRKAVATAPIGKPFPGIVDILHEFKAAGINMVVLSSDLPATLLPEITHFVLDGIFLDVITDVHDKSEVIHELMRKNSFTADETIFIGDSNHEIEAGKFAGVKTGAVTWGLCTREKLEALQPDFMITTVHELKAVILD
jgi:phosphoglycolate phosphatase-like HAD superfamily hydrolase